jgi:hypothetical protein
MKKILTTDVLHNQVEVTSDARRRQTTIKFNIDRKSGNSQAITFMTQDNFIDFVKQMNIGLEILKEQNNKL